MGRAEGTGRAILYGTTKEFLNYFGLKNIKELPPLPEDVDTDDEQPTDLFLTKFQETFNQNEKEGPVEKVDGLYDCVVTNEYDTDSNECSWSRLCRH